MRDFNGDISCLSLKERETIPNIVLVLNNFSAFTELYEEYIDDFCLIAREGTKYGITIVLTAISANAVRYKIQQYFKQYVALQLNDNSEFSSIFGSTDGVYPSKIRGRGIIKFERVYEFQSAQVNENEFQNEDILRLCKESSAKSTKTARKIPILPEKVDFGFVKNKN